VEQAKGDRVSGVLGYRRALSNLLDDRMKKPLRTVRRNVATAETYRTQMIWRYVQAEAVLGLEHLKLVTRAAMQAVASDLGSAFS
jgi:hypothetical protein